MVNDIYLVHLVNSKMNSSKVCRVCFISFILTQSILFNPVSDTQEHIHRLTDVVIVELNVNRQTKLIYIEKEKKNESFLSCLPITKEYEKRYEVFIHCTIDNYLLEKICS